MPSVPPAVRHDECGSEGAKPNEREERGASPRSRPSPARLRRRASECEIFGAYVVGPTSGVNPETPKLFGRDDNFTINL